MERAGKEGTSCFGSIRKNRSLSGRWWEARQGWDPPDEGLGEGGVGQPGGGGSQVAEAGRAGMPGRLTHLYFVLEPPVK